MSLSVSVTDHGDTDSHNTVIVGAAARLVTELSMETDSDFDVASDTVTQVKTLHRLT